MKVEFGDLAYQFSEIESECYVQVLEILRSGNYVSGKYVEKFEREFAEYTQSLNVTCVNSGTSALHAGLISIGVTAGDEVILPSHTFIATATAVVMTGATPVLVEVDDNALIQRDAALNAITEKTKCVIPVHLYGSLVSTEDILDFKSHGLRILEDASQAHGAQYADSLGIGNYSDGATYSFYPGKNLGAAGEGGAVTTNNLETGNALKLIRNWGSPQRYVHQSLGFNYRMDEIQAMILSFKLKKMKNWNEMRTIIADQYVEELQGLPMSFVNERRNKSVYHQFVIRIQERDKLQDFLSKHGVNTQIHYPQPIHKQPALQEYFRIGSNLANTNSLTKEILSLPIYPGLSQDSISYICQKIRSFYGKA